MNKLKNDKQIKLNEILSMIKLLSLFFPGIALYQHLNITHHDNVHFSTYMIMISLVVFSVTYLTWILAEKKLKSLGYTKWIYPTICVLVCAIGIYFTGAHESRYKFLFLFIIISFTIEFGLKSGLILSGICSALLLGTDLLYSDSATITANVESDLIMGLGFITIAWILGYYSQIEKNHIQHLEDAVNIDGLTKLYNHHYFHMSLEKTLHLLHPTDAPTAVILLDVDYFKVYNDMHGHLHGDEVLRQLAQIIKSNELPGQISARYGGEEFGIILANISEEKAVKHAETIRLAIEAHPFVGQEYMPQKNLTVSIGVASTIAGSQNKTDLISQADQALYNAKFLHKNMVKKYVSLLDEFSRGAKEDSAIITSIKTLIAVINSKDKITYTHVERVVIYADLMSVKLNMNQTDRKHLIYGAYMHDLGKINIDTSILTKTTKLTTEEWLELQKHPVQGAEVVKNLGALEVVKPLILQHHEKYDGTGYPYGIKGESINYLARILTVIDSFDAMTSQRPYQITKTFEQAFEELRRCSGSQFDPQIVELFIEAVSNVHKENVPL